MKYLGWMACLFAFLYVDVSSVWFLSEQQVLTHANFMPVFGVLSAEAQEHGVRRRRGGRNSRAKRELAEALNLAKQGQALEAEGRYEEAFQVYADVSRMLFDLKSKRVFRGRQTQISYILGLMLFKMGLHQVSAFQFSEVVRKQDKKYLNLSIEKLILLTSEILKSNAVLNYSLSKVNLQTFPRTHRNQLRLRIGEVQIGNKQFKEASGILSKVEEGNAAYPRAKYLEGLAYAESNEPRKALRAFAELVKSRADFPVNDSVRATGLMGMARAAYQLKDWDRSIALYRQVPRDTPQWSEALFEVSWAQLRAAQLRFVLGNFHSLHSPFYEESYHPESLILRAILYLYICQYDEMGRTLDFFKKTYFPVRQKLVRYLRRQRTPRSVYRDFDKLYSQNETSSYIIPDLVVRHVAKEGNVRDGLSYLQQLQGELDKIQQMSSAWQDSGMGRYAKKLLNRRIRNARTTIGQNILAHLRRIRTDLSQFVEQHGLAQYEMLSAKKDQLKRKIVEKKVKKASIQSERSRDFYVQGGFEYWPFQGEYWLDEVGNYYYLGANSCE